MSEEKEHRIEVNWVQSAAGALAAMSSAILLSTVGVAGTIIGAAIGSVFATAGSAVYSYYLRTSKVRAAAAAQAARGAAARARARKQSASGSSAAESTRVLESEAAAADEQRAEEIVRRVESGETPEESKPTWREVVRDLDWKRIALVALGLFAVVMGVILTFELLTGRAVSSYTGGSDEDKRTSVNWGGGNDATEQQDQDQEQDQDQDQEQGDEEIAPNDVPAEEPTTDVTTPEPEQDVSEAPDTEEPEEEPVPTEAPTTSAPEPPAEEEPAPIEPPEEPAP
ncbi:MAG: hypothetical protein M3Q39_12875 [Actinomycetota bacterium]|nr:hypothetical protein [Actinomycetota bacterium]